MSQPTFRTPPAVAKAQLKALPNGEAIPVHFNPASLVYTVENSTQQQSGNPNRSQFAARFTGKLTMDLQFDTTDTGADVRQVTNKIALFMQSSAAANKKQSGGKGTNAPAPPVLSFDWGSYHFQGFMESFKETIDFFSADGIPLRALVSIGLARQDKVFDAGTTKQAPVGGSLVPTAASGNPADLSSKAGDKNATRALASSNGLENPRFTGGAPLQVGGGIQLNAAVGFVASASAGAGFSAGASAGASAGVSVGAGVSVSSGAGGQVTLGAGGGALFGSQASAGVPATAGAFAGLEVGRATISTTAQLDPLRMLPATVGSDVAAGGSASFGLGGVALAQAGFSADVGASLNLSDSLTFDMD